MFKKISTLTLALAITASSFATSPEVLFYENFDNGNVNQFNHFIQNTAGTGAFATTSFTQNSQTVAPFRGSHGAEIGLCATSNNTIRRYGKFTRGMGTNETILLTYWYYDSYVLSPLFGTSSPNQFVELRDYNPDFSPGAAGAGFNQIVAIGTGTGTSSTAVTMQTSINGGWLGNVSNDLNYYKGRVVSVTAGSGIAGGIFAPSWATIGNTTTGPDSWIRSLGWRKLQIAYSNKRAAFMVDGRQGFFWDHNKVTSMDMVVLGTGLATVNTKGFYDEVSVKAFPAFSINYKVGFNDFSAERAQIENMPVEVELLDDLGTPIGPIQNVFVDNTDTITVQAPAAGTYSLRIKGKTFLTKQVNGIAVTEFGVFTGSVALINGDINNDNFVGFDDFDLLSVCFGQALGDPNFNADADLNKDDFNGFDDFDILSAQFGNAGD